MTKDEMEKMAIEHACLRYLCNGRPELDLGKAFEAGAQAGIELERKRSEGLVEQFKKVRNFLDNDIGGLPCESRQRDLPEETWEFAMYYRDCIDIALTEYEEGE